MDRMAELGILAAATILAAAAAFGMAWALLRGAFRLMEPAGFAWVQKPSARTRLELAQGTRAAARVWTKRVN
jgi:hypothetical protein